MAYVPYDVFLGNVVDPGLITVTPFSSSILEK
jgi:hypothetical protein